MTRGELPGPAPGDREQPSARRTADGIRIEAGQQTEHPPERTVLSALVDHEPGVLATVAGLFSRRQYNIESLTVGETADETLARMTIVVVEDAPSIEQAGKQLEKQPEVHSVRELDAAVQRELAIVKVDGATPEEVNAVTDMYDGRTLEVTTGTITVELTGDERTIDAAIDAYRQFGVQEVARTGYAALARGEDRTGREAPAGEATTADQDTGEGRRSAGTDTQPTTTPPTHTND